MDRCRSWFAWLFLLATIVAQGPHRHDRPAPLFAEEFGSCDEAGRHWAGHEATGLEDGTDACPLCQLRAQPMLVEPVAVAVEPAEARVWPVAELPQTHARPTLRIRCRAPPEG